MRARVGEAKHYTLVLIVVVLLKKSQKTGLLHKARHQLSVYLFFVIFRCVWLFVFSVLPSLHFLLIFSVFGSWFGSGLVW